MNTEAGIKDLWRRWFRRPFTESDHSATEDEIIRKIGRELERKIQVYGPLLVTKVAEIAQAVGLEPVYWPYLYYVLERSTRKWPRLNERSKAALFFVREIMMKEGATPPYSGLVAEPATEDEPAVDEVFRRLGKWASRELPQQILRDLQKILKKYVPVIEKRYPTLRGPKAYAFLAALLEHDLEAHSQWFSHPTRLWGALKLSGVLG